MRRIAVKPLNSQGPKQEVREFIQSVCNKSKINEAAQFQILRNQEIVNQFTELRSFNHAPESISKIICGSGATLEQVITTLADQEIHKKLHDLKKINYTLECLSPMLYQSGAGIREAINAISSRKGKLQELGTSTKKGGSGFNVVEIASILSGSGANVGEAIDAMISKKNELKKLSTSTKEDGFGFTNEHITSILSGSGANVGEAIEQLASDKTRGNLYKLRNFKFSLQHIASILSGSGANVGEAIEQLASDKTRKSLNKLHSMGFNFANIASIFFESGINAAKAIDVLCESDVLKKLTKSTKETGFGFAAKDIASILCGSWADAENLMNNLSKFVSNFYSNNPRCMSNEDSLKKAISEITILFSGYVNRNLLRKLDSSNFNNLAKQIEDKLDIKSHETTLASAEIQLAAPPFVYFSPSVAGDARYGNIVNVSSQQQAIVQASSDWWTKTWSIRNVAEAQLQSTSTHSIPNSFGSVSDSVTASTLSGEGGGFISSSSFSSNQECPDRGESSMRISISNLLDSSPRESNRPSSTLTRKRQHAESDEEFQVQQLGVDKGRRK